MDRYQARVSYLASNLQYWLYQNNGLTRVTDADERIRLFDEEITRILDRIGAKITVEGD